MFLKEIKITVTVITVTMKKRQEHDPTVICDFFIFASSEQIEIRERRENCYSIMFDEER